MLAKIEFGERYTYQPTKFISRFAHSQRLDLGPEDRSHYLTNCFSPPASFVELDMMNQRNNILRQLTSAHPLPPSVIPEHRLLRLRTHAETQRPWANCTMCSRNRRSALTVAPAPQFNVAPCDGAAT